MENEVKCKICGCVILLSIVVAVNYPICKTCFKKLKEHPDIPVEQKQTSAIGQIFVTGVNTSASTMSSMSFDIFNDDRWKGIL